MVYVPILYRVVEDGSVALTTRWRSATGHVGA